MNKQIVIHQESILVSGEINFSTVTPLWEESQKLLSSQINQWQFDFSQVTACNSAGLALLLEWVKLAKQQNKQIQFNHIPQQLRSIAVAAGLGKVLIL